MKKILLVATMSLFCVNAFAINVLKCCVYENGLSTNSPCQSCNKGTKMVVTEPVVSAEKVVLPLDQTKIKTKTKTAP